MDPTVPFHRLALDAHAKARPEAPALVAVDDLGNAVRWTYAQLEDRSRRLAAYLRDGEGVARGDRVAVVLPQRAEALLAHLACARLGAIAVPVSPLYGPDGLAERLADARPTVVVTGREEGRTVREAVATLGGPDAPDTSDASDAPSSPAAPTAETRPALLDVDDPATEAAWLDADPLPASGEAQVGGDDPAWLIYTSGTTRRPKGVVLPHRVIAGRMGGFEAVQPGFGPGRLFYSPADWAWIGGLMDACLAPLAAGGAVLAVARREGFDAAEAARRMVDHDVTHAFLAPTALKALARVDLPKDLRLDAVHAAGEPLPQAVAEWAGRSLADAVGTVYGQTEAAFLLGTSTALDDGAPPWSTGRPFPGAEVDLDDGEVVVGPGTATRMLGYWAGPDAPPELPVDDDGWLRTGDLAVRDDDGVYWFQDRLDDLIKTSGHRVSPAEVEACLMDHPAVAAAAVVGEPDPERGQAVVAYVVPEAHVQVGPGLARDVQEFVRVRLAAHAYPREVRFVEALPRGPTGKVRRRELGKGDPADP